MIPVTIGLTLLATHYLPALLKTSAASPKVAVQPAPFVPLDFFKKTPKPGRARIHVTWEYNKFVGSRSDTNSTVILIPKELQEKGSYLGLSPTYQDDTFNEAKKYLQKQGIYASRVGGNGSALLSNVPEGEYTLIIVSKNTNDSMEARTVAKTEMARYMLDGDIASVHKVHITDLTVIAGEEVEYSHDFGNTRD
jgi:hypothetical protein